MNSCRSESDQESDQSIAVFGARAASRRTSAAISSAAAGGSRRNASTRTSSFALSCIRPSHQYTTVVFASHPEFLFSKVCTFVHIIKRGVRMGPGESSGHFTKHHVRFADAVTALEDDLALTIRDPSLEGEERWVTIGLDASGRLLVVVYTWRGERVRLISARRATHQEQRQYKEGT